MTLFYGYKRLGRPEDWQGLAGSENWVPGHSAFELAYAWQGSGGIPPGIAAALATGATTLAGLRLDVALVEKPVFLDTQVGPSMTDLMGYARNARGEAVVLAVEGKAQEVFGLPVRSWLRGDQLVFNSEAAVRPTRSRRFNYLCARLGLNPDPDCQLRYQLLHRTASAISEAELHSAVAAVVVVHAFGTHSTGNWSDFELFLDALHLKAPSPGAVAGPARLGSQRTTDTYFLWWQDTVHGDTA
jgi:hypothetical protein